MGLFEFILSFAENHPFLSFVGICCIYWICKLPFFAWNRLLRHLNIRKNGWPVNPLMDADGDIVHPPKQESKTASNSL